MDPNSYPSNSLTNPAIGPTSGANATASSPTTSQPGRAPVKPVTRGTVSSAKPSFGKRLKGVLIAEDIGDIKSYLFRDVIGPGIRDMIVFSLINSVRMIFYGKNAAGRPGIGGYGFGYSFGNMFGAYRSPFGSVNPGVGYTPYGSMSIGGVKANGQPMQQTQMAQPGLLQPNMIRIPTRGEAELVRDQLAEIMGAYGRVTVADFFDTVGVSGNGSGVDGNYGWNDLTGMMIQPYPDGFGFSMPRAKPLNLM